MRVLLVLALSLMSMASCSDDQGGVACEDLRARFDALAENPANRVCQDSSDCALFGSTGTCSCAPHLSAECSGRALTTPPSTEVATVLRQADACGDLFAIYGATCDCGPARVDCVGGMCTEALGDACLMPSGFGQDAGN